MWLLKLYETYVTIQWQHTGVVNLLYKIAHLKKNILTNVLKDFDVNASITADVSQKISPKSIKNWHIINNINSKSTIGDNLNKHTDIHVYFKWLFTHKKLSQKCKIYYNKASVQNHITVSEWV